MSDLANVSTFANGNPKRTTVEFSTHLPEKLLNISSPDKTNSGLGQSLQGIRRKSVEPLPPATRPIPKKPGMTLKFSEDVNTEAHEYHPPKTPYPYQSYLPFDEEEEADSDLDNEQDSEVEEDATRLDQEDEDLFPVDN